MSSILLQYKEDLRLLSEDSVRGKTPNDLLSKRIRELKSQEDIKIKIGNLDKFL